MYFPKVIIFFLSTFLFMSGVASAQNNRNILGNPVKDSESKSRLTVICQRKNPLKSGALHDDLWVFYQSNHDQGNGEQLLYRAGRGAGVEEVSFSAKKFSEAKDGISVDDEFLSTASAQKLNSLLNEDRDSESVTAKITRGGHFTVKFMGEKAKERFLIRTYAQDITLFKDKYNKETYYKCNIFVLPEAKSDKDPKVDESCTVSKEDPDCVPVETDSLQ